MKRHSVPLIMKHKLNVHWDIILHLSYWEEFQSCTVYSAGKAIEKQVFLDTPIGNAKW